MNRFSAWESSEAPGASSGELPSGLVDSFLYHISHEEEPRKGKAALSSSASLSLVLVLLITDSFLSLMARENLIFLFLFHPPFFYFF